MHTLGCVAEAGQEAQNSDLGNEHVGFDTQVEHVPGPHIVIMAAMETRPHRVELDADAGICLFGCQQLLVHLATHMKLSAPTKRPAVWQSVSA